MSSLATKKINSKLIWPIIIIILVVVGYFVYQSFFSTTEIGLDAKNNAYVSQTKLGQYIDVLNKESLVFNTNINNDLLLNSKDFSIEIPMSQGVGRPNPFLP